MGIFSSECEKCGASVKKRAKFCSKCGHPGPKAWIKCGGCQKWIGVESEFCPHCKKPQHISERNLVANNQVIREPGIFLQRIDIDDIKGVVKDFLVIEHGTVAIFMENGKTKSILPPGKHSTKDGFLRSVFTLGTTHIKSLFIVDSGDIALPFSVRGLRSKEDMTLDFYTEAIFSFDKENVSNLIENTLKDKRQLKHEELGAILNFEVNSAVKNLCNTTLIDDLIKDSDTLLAFEDELRNRLKILCERMGIKLSRVAALDFFGESYEKLRDLAGDVERKTREAVLNQRLRELGVSGRMNEVKSDFDLKTYENQLAHEYNISSEIQSFERKEIIDELRIKLEAKNREAQRLEELKAHEHQLNMKKKSVESEIDETRKWMDVRKDKEAMKLAADAERLDTYSKYNSEQLATMLPPEQVEQILKVRQIKMQEKILEMQADMTPEQILAINSANSKSAADALSSMNKAKIEAAEDKAKMAKENTDAMERIMTKTIEANADVAKAKAANNGVNNGIKIIK